MKNYRITHILAGLTLCAAMSFMMASCEKHVIEPFDLTSLEPKTDVVLEKPDTTAVEPPAETQDTTAVVPPQNAQDTTAVEPPAETQDTTAVVPVGKLSLTLHDLDTLGYSGVPIEIPFRIQSASGKVKFRRSKSYCMKARVNISGNTGTITLTASAKESWTEIMLGDENDSLIVRFDVRTYYLALNESNVKEMSLSVGPEENTCPFELHTNLPPELIEIEADPWIKTSFSQNICTLRISANETNGSRSGKIRISERSGNLSCLMVNVSQTYPMQIREGMVPFKDSNFRDAMLYADHDGDGYVSLEEAAAVQEVNIAGKGIRDLTGLEAFRNAWKVDARNNDIKNADVLKELHYLHWLDLKGNWNLESFDVTGCSVYFERCWYEVTPQLRYKTFLRQLNITYDCDMYCAHGDVDFDHRVSTDYSRQGELVQWHEHTVGDGKKVLVFTGLGYLDVDHQDGSFDRVMKDALKLYLEACPKLEEHFEEFDVYMMRHIMRTRDEFVFPGAMWNTDEVKPIKKAYSQERTYILRESYNKVSLPGENKLVLTFSIDIHPNVRVVPAVGSTFVLDNWSNDYNNEYQMLEQVNPVPTLDIDKLNEYGFRNRRLETVIVDIVKCGNNYPETIYDFFGIQ